MSSARDKRDDLLRKAEGVEGRDSAVKAMHTVVEGETLSGIALKYYASATKENWMKIYAANKALIGDDPGKIKPGQVLKIPNK